MGLDCQMHICLKCEKAYEIHEVISSVVDKDMLAQKDN